MGRKYRIWLPHAFYHIVSRGNRRDVLFHDHSDFVVFLQILEKLFEKSPFQLVSYCLMSNHYHLLLRSPEQNLSKLMALLNRRYALYYNTKYNVTGHVFEKRYFAEMIDHPFGMLKVSQYIHLNPLSANIVTHPEDYLWSSFFFYSSPIASPPVFIDSTHLLTYFPGTKEEQRRQYVNFCLS